MNNSNQSAALQKATALLPWTPPTIVDLGKIPTGDMPGDKVVIGTEHLAKAEVIFPELVKQLQSVFASGCNRAVVAVCGGSGVGKSEIASLLSYYLNQGGLGAYTLSGDNYPHRVPMYNDAERLRIFRQSGIRGLLAQGQYTTERGDLLLSLQQSGADADPALTAQYPWLAGYQQAADSGLRGYLGTKNEIDFDEVTSILSQFKNGAETIYLKRMGREEASTRYEAVDFSDKSVLVIEWTHGNSYHIGGVDIPVCLYSTPAETLAHRRARNRDKGTDSPFTNRVLSLEAELLDSQLAKAKIIVSKDGALTDADATLVRKLAQKKQEA